jgi:hypothetical protein
MLYQLACIIGVIFLPILPACWVERVIKQD